jgi:AcrR family transcriptional regulator
MNQSFRYPEEDSRMASRRNGTRTPASQAGEPDKSPVRGAILAGFSYRARRSGIRAVLMVELASELRMSPMTLYKHFASKDELVSEMVDAWAIELAAINALEWERAVDCNSALEVLLSWADTWTAVLSDVSPAFFRDLRRDHPDAWKRFHSLIDDRKAIAATHLTPYLREDVPPGAMLLMLDKLVQQAADRRFASQLGISRRDAVRAALALWGGGALRQRTNLRAVPPPTIPLQRAAAKPKKKQPAG